MRAIGTVCALAVTLPLLVLGQPAGQPDPQVAIPAPGVPTSIHETFETQIPQGWEIGPGIQVQQMPQGGSALVFGQPGSVWLPVSTQDFALSFRHRPGGGILEVIVRASGEPPNQRGYHVILSSEEVGLVREFGEGNASELGGTPHQLQAGAWNQVGLQVSGGQIVLSLNGQQLLAASDPQPLPQGGIGFISHQGGDAVDDISLTPGAGGAMTPTPQVPTQTTGPTAQQPGVQPVQPPGYTTPTETVPQQPALTATGGQQGAIFSESFAAQPQQGWEFGDGATVQNGELTFTSPGGAFWVAVQQKDLTLRCRYRPGQGEMAIVLCGSGEPPNNHEYRLVLQSAQIAFERASQGQEMQLASGQYAWQPQQWHDLAVQVLGEQIAVHVNNQPVFTATDPQPPPAGTVGFIAPEGGGAAIDDVYISVPQTGASQQPTQPGLPQQPTQPGIAQQPTQPGVVRQPVQIPTGPAAQGTMLSETFEQQPQQGWEFSGGATVQNGALTFNGTGDAFVSVAQMRDFALSFRYRPGGGVARVAMAESGEETGARSGYALMMPTDEMGFDVNSAGQPQPLAGGPMQWQQGQWHTILVKVVNGQAQVTVNGQVMRTATIPQPLTGSLFGFGQLEGSGAAFDDISISAPQAGAVQRPTQPGVPQQPTQPGMTQQPVGAGGQAIDTSILLPNLFPRLQEAGIANGQQLVASLQNAAALNQLSTRTNLPGEDLLHAASLCELGRVLGSQTVAQNATVLQLLDLDRPEDLVRFHGQPQTLQKVAAQAAAATGQLAPDLATVQGWLAAAANGTSQLPRAEQLLPHQLQLPAPLRTINLTPPPPVSTISLEQDTFSSVQPAPQGMIQVQPQLQQMTPTPTNPQGGLQQFLTPGGASAQLNAPPPTGANTGAIVLQAPDLTNVMALSLHRLNVSIPAGQTGYTGEFLADRPGLYRLRCRFSRPGGVATLRWFVDKPQEALQVSAPPGQTPTQQFPAIGPGQPTMTATPQVTGWQPLIQGAQELAADPERTETDHYLYFWLRRSDVPMTNRLQLRLAVTKNLKFSGTQDQIEGTSTATVPDQGPISGVVLVTWVNPVTVQAGKSASVGANDFPLTVVETSVQSNPTGQAGAGTWNLTAWLDRVPPAPLSQDQYGNVVYSGAEPMNLWNNIEMLYNGTPIQAQPLMNQPQGAPARAKHVTVQSPKGGVYSLLVSPEGVVPLSQLTSSGKVYSYARYFDQASNQWQQQPRYSGAQQVNVGFLSQGGSRMSITAELVALEVKDQFDGEDAPGEFHVECTASRIRTPNIAGDPTAAMNEMYQGAKVWATTRNWPTFAAGPGCVTVPTDSQGRHIVFPRYLLAEWEEGSQQYNAGSVSLAVWEDDAPSFWDDVEVLVSAIKRLAKIFIAAYSGNFGQATTGLIEHVTALNNYTPTNVDDIVGYPAMGWDESCVFPATGFTAFSMQAASNPAYSTVMQTGQAAWMTDVAPGGDAPAVTAGVLLRRVPAYWARADNSLLSFTLSHDLDSPGDLTDVVVLNHRSNWMADYGWGGDTMPTSIAGGHTSAAVHQANANQRVVVDPGAPPPALAQLVQQYGFDQSAAFYVEWHFWDQDPGRDTHIATFSRTFYYHDFIKYAGQKGKWQYLDGGKTRVNYYKEGGNYVGHFILDDPGGYLKQVELKVYARIFDG